jgi:hypothetical protein
VDVASGGLRSHKNRANLVLPQNVQKKNWCLYYLGQPVQLWGNGEAVILNFQAKSKDNRGSKWSL